MRFSTFIFAGSIVVNVALLTLIAVGLSRHVASATPPPRTPKTAAAHEAAPLGPEAWASLATGDLGMQRDRLRAEGVPPELVRAILTAQIRESFAARRKALERAQGDIPFWKNPATDSDTATALRALAREERSTLRELLGPDPDSDTAVNLRQQLPNLPADKIYQLATLRERYDEQRQEIYAAARGVPTPDDQQKIKALNATMHANLAVILTPQELADYDLRFSSSARAVGFSIEAFDATEKEFSGLVQLQQAFDEKYAGGTLSSDEVKARVDAVRKLNEDRKALLGPERYADYQRNTDGDYRQTSKLVARLELPPETTDQVVALQQDFTQRTRTLDRIRTLPLDERNAQLTALAAEAQSKVTTLLGAQGYEAYKQYGGQWLQQLQPRPAPVARPATGGRAGGG